MYSLPRHEMIDFGKFMDTGVARLVRKPARVAFTLNRLNVRQGPHLW